MIITMPTIFTTNAMENSIKHESGTDCRSYNSSTKNLKNNIIDEDELNFFNFDLYQRRTFQYPLTICTIDTLLNSIVQKSEDAHSANFNINNSCVVIDEFDFYDDLVIANIKVLLKYLFIMRVKVILMSATFPPSFRNFFLDIDPNYKVSPLIIDDTNDDKKRYKIHKIQKYDVSKPETLSKSILKKVDNAKKTIVFCNTQKSCLRMYFFFVSIYGKDKVIVYNSYHSSPDKKIKEKLIIDDIGKNPTTDNYKVIIMSQIGELSLNISCDYMISEVCPCDRLTQRFGRIGRFDDPNNPIIREIALLIPMYRGKEYPAPYGKLVPSKGWFEAKVLTTTKKLLKRRTYTNGELQKIIEKVYIKGVELLDDVKNNVREYETLIKTNSLILPNVVVDDDTMNESNTTQWQRRRFMTKANLYLLPFEKNEINNKTFNYITTRDTVDIYVYQLRQLCDSGFATEQVLTIKDEFFGDRQITIQYLNRPEMYSQETGLNLLMVE
jgi:CRISPR-associated endonuclease/helicase Cas3